MVLPFQKYVDRAPSSPFEYVTAMGTDEKKTLCLDLLEEFGVRNLRKDTGRHELIHSCLLPFGLHAHGDANASASLNYERLTYRCLGCDSKGGLLWFIATCRGTDTDAAREWLQGTTGVGGADGMTLVALLKFFDSIYGPKTIIPNPIPVMDQRVLTPWMAIHPYLTEMRGITAQTIMDFRVGWNAETDRIVIPHFWHGDLVGWQTRRLRKSDSTPKYLSSPDMPKDTTLFNHPDARPWEPPVDEDPFPLPVRKVVVVESPMSVLALAPHVPNVVATFGASITDRQAQLIGRFPEVTVFLDADDAGWRATERLCASLEAYSVVRVVENAWAADPADFVAAGMVQEVLRLIFEATPASCWTRPATLEALPTQEVPA